MLVGIISDTHGLLRPEALAALAGADKILHAGDVGRPEILDALERIAPVTAVRGNVDTGPPLSDLPETATLRLAGIALHMIHDLNDLPDAAPYGVVVSGHSHKPTLTRRHGTLLLNPGAAGPRRFSLPVTVAHLRIETGTPTAEILHLDVPPPKRR